MTSPRLSITSPGGENRQVSLTRASELTGMHPEMILEFVRAELVRVQTPSSPSRRESPLFDESALVRLRHIERLRQDHVNMRTVRYIVHLLDQLESARHELRALRERLR